MKRMQFNRYISKKLIKFSMQIDLFLFMYQNNKNKNNVFFSYKRKREISAFTD